MFIVVYSEGKTRIENHVKYNKSNTHIEGKGIFIQGVSG